MDWETSHKKYMGPPVQKSLTKWCAELAHTQFDMLSDLALPMYLFLMLGSNLVQVAAAVIQFDPTIRLRYKNQRKQEEAPSRLT